MEISFNRVDGPEDTVLTVTTSKGTAAAAISKPNPELLSKDLIAANSNLNSLMAELQSSVQIYEETVHPRLLDAKIFEAIKKTMTGPIKRLISAGQSDRRTLDEAFDRAAEPRGTINEQLRGNYQARLLGMDATAVMQALNKPNPSVELILAVLDTAELTGLPDEYLHSLRERLILKNSETVIGSDASADPSADNPFATGVDPEKAQKLAKAMLDRHRSKVKALDTVEASVSRVVTMLAVLCGASGPDVIWAAIRP